MRNTRLALVPVERPNIWCFALVSLVELRVGIDLCRLELALGRRF
jgi:hypothetical protein